MMFRISLRYQDSYVQTRQTFYENMTYLNYFFQPVHWNKKVEYSSLGGATPYMRDLEDGGVG